MNKNEKKRKNEKGDLIIAKLHTYGFDENSLALVYSYLKERKQSVRISNTYSSFQTILSGVPQGSVLGPILSISI